MNGLICLAMLQEVNNIPFLGFLLLFFVFVCVRFKVTASTWINNVQRINWIFGDYVQLKETLMRT